MHTPSDEQREMIQNKTEYIQQKAKLLKEYKSFAPLLEYAENDFDREQLEHQREKLAIKIKALGNKIRQIEAWETQTGS
jgi:hypothetical protein